MIYTLDASVLVDALRHPSELDHLKAFLSWALPHTTMTSVVASELLAGARTSVARKIVDTELLAAFVRRDRVVAPSANAWMKTGRLLGQFAGEFSQNDLLLAHTARERGWSVITRDGDFGRIRERLPGLRVELPYPRQPSAR